MGRCHQNLQVLIVATPGTYPCLNAFVSQKARKKVGAVGKTGHIKQWLMRWFHQPSGGLWSPRVTTDLKKTVSLDKMDVLEVGLYGIKPYWSPSPLDPCPPQAPLPKSLGISQFGIGSHERELKGSCLSQPTVKFHKRFSDANLFF